MGKKTIIAALLFISINCFGQTKTNKVDSLTNDTKFISVNDVSKALDKLDDKITVQQAKTFNDIFQEIVQQLAQEYYDKQKSQPKIK
jgi:uncharacterized protein YoxC